TLCRNARALEVRGDAVLLPIAVARGIGSVLAADLLGRLRAGCLAGIGQPAALLCFGKRATGLRGQLSLGLGVSGLVRGGHVQPAVVSAPRLNKLSRIHASAQR